MYRFVPLAHSQPVMGLMYSINVPGTTIYLFLLLQLTVGGLMGRGRRRRRVLSGREVGYTFLSSLLKNGNSIQMKYMPTLPIHSHRLTGYSMTGNKMRLLDFNYEASPYFTFYYLNNLMYIN